MPYRVREKYKAEPCAVYDPVTGAHEVPDPGRRYEENEPIVKAAPWYFIAEGETESTEAPTSVRISEVEQATAAPGEKRTLRRRA